MTDKEIKPDVPNELLSELDLYRLRANMAAEKFKETENPLEGIEAFVLARRAKEDPPETILQWIEDNFTKWHKAQGEKSLDEVFGIIGKPGDDPLFKKAFIADRNNQLFMDMVRLRMLRFSKKEKKEKTIIKRFSIEEAAVAVAAKLEIDNPSDPIYGVTIINAASLEKEFKKWPERNDAWEWCSRNIPDDVFLNAFPEHARPSWAVEGNLE